MDTKRHKTRQADAIDMKIMELCLSHPELTDLEIGQRVGLSRSAVIKRRKHEAYVSLFERAFENAQTNLKALMEKAVAEMGRSLNDPDPRIRLAAASQILKHMPELPEPEKSESRIVHIDLSWADEDESVNRIAAKPS
jgi:hypothetical protein